MTTPKELHEQWRPVYFAVQLQRRKVQEQIDKLIALNTELKRVNAEIDMYLEPKAVEYRQQYDPRRIDEELRVNSVQVKYRILPAHKALILT